MKSDVLAVISARGDSKRIPRKNLAVVAGKPLIAWTIEAALQASVLDRVVVSTDNPEIASVARGCGAEVPFLRPAELARDDTPGIAPVIHAVQWLRENQGHSSQYVMLLQPTSPLRTVEDIEGAILLARERQADAVVSVCPAKETPYGMKKVTADGRLADFLPRDRLPPPEHDSPLAYTLNGAIYLVRCCLLLERETFYTDRAYAYVMPPERSLDVDTPWDLHLAELLLQVRTRRAQG